MVDANGRRSNVRLSNLGSADLAVGENSRFVEAVGSVSNMGALGWTEDRENFRLVTDAEVYDEAYADAANVLYMVFQNNEGRMLTYEVPAPQAVIFEADGVTLRPLPTDSANDDAVEEAIRELIAASENIINTSFAPVNSYTFISGSRRPRKTDLPRPAGGRPQTVVPPANTGTGDG
jgi:hypothetical protein